MPPVRDRRLQFAIIIPAFLWIKVDPRYDALRFSPRFQRVLSEMKLTD